MKIDARFLVKTGSEILPTSPVQQPIGRIHSNRADLIEMIDLLRHKPKDLFRTF